MKHDDFCIPDVPLSSMLDEIDFVQHHCEELQRNEKALIRLLQTIIDAADHSEHVPKELLDRINQARDWLSICIVE